MSDQLTPLGQYIEAKRGATSKRTAARTAGISEGRWRQIVRGYQQNGKSRIEARPRAETVKAMAGAVGADINQALELAGFEPNATPVTPETDELVAEAVDAMEGTDLDTQRMAAAAAIAVVRARKRHRQSPE